MDRLKYIFFYLIISSVVLGTVAVGFYFYDKVYKLGLATEQIHELNYISTNGHREVEDLRYVDSNTITYYEQIGSTQEGILKTSSGGTAVNISFSKIASGNFIDVGGIIYRIIFIKDATNGVVELDAVVTSGTVNSISTFDLQTIDDPSITALAYGTEVMKSVPIPHPGVCVDSNSTGNLLYYINTATDALTSRDPWGVVSAGGTTLTSTTNTRYILNDTANSAIWVSWANGSTIYLDKFDYSLVNQGEWSTSFPSSGTSDYMGFTYDPWQNQIIAFGGDSSGGSTNYGVKRFDILSSSWLNTQGASAFDNGGMNWTLSDDATNTVRESCSRISFDPNSGYLYMAPEYAKYLFYIYIYDIDYGDVQPMMAYDAIDSVFFSSDLSRVLATQGVGISASANQISELYSPWYTNNYGYYASSTARNIGVTEYGNIVVFYDSTTSGYTGYTIFDSSWNVTETMLGADGHLEGFAGGSIVYDMASDFFYISAEGSYLGNPNGIPTYLHKFLGGQSKINTPTTVITTDSSQADVSAWTQVSGVTLLTVYNLSNFNQVNSYYTVSFDDRQSFKVFTSGAWRTVASSLNSDTGGANGSWYYRDDADTWSVVLENNAPAAISAALNASYINNLMDINEILALTSSDFSTTGGFSLNTNTIDLGITVTSSYSWVSTQPGIVSATLTGEDAVPISFTLSSDSGSESVTSPTITLEIPFTVGYDASVNYTVTGGTASQGSDYILNSGTTTISASSLTTTIPLSIINDSAAGEGSETVVITISNPSPYGQTVLGSITEFTYTITDDDTPGLTITDVNYVADETISIGDTLYFELNDASKNTNPSGADTAAITVSATNGDSEPVTLSETGVDTGIFRGSLNTASSNSSGILYLEDGDTITASLTSGFVIEDFPSDQGSQWIAYTANTTSSWNAAGYQDLGMNADNPGMLLMGGVAAPIGTFDFGSNGLKLDLYFSDVSWYTNSSTYGGVAPLLNGLSIALNDDTNTVFVQNAHTYASPSFAANQWMTFQIPQVDFAGTFNWNNVKRIYLAIPSNGTVMTGRLDNVESYGAGYSDTATAESVSLEEIITVTGTVVPVISFTSNVNTCSLGEMTVNSVYTCSYQLTTATNAPGGMILKISADTPYLASGANSIDVCGGTNCNADGTAGVTAGSEEYGFYVSDLGANHTAEGYTGNAQPMPSTPTTFISSGGPHGYTTSTVTQAAAVSFQTPPGSYSQTITISAYGSF